MLVGAINGVDAFSKEWVDDAVSANRELCNFDIERNARAFYDAVYAGSGL